MAGILYLVHRLPFPPNKGDKIRSYHLLRYLASRGPVYLGAFIDDPLDWQHVDELKKWCKDIYVAEVRPSRAKIESLRGLLMGEALTLPYYRHAGLKRWTRMLTDAGHVDRALAFSSAMAQFVPEQLSCKLMDMVDVDSDKWAQYAPGKPWPLSWLYRREALKLGQWEDSIASRFDATFLVSESEADMLRARVPESAGKILSLENGVDAAYFSPDLEYPNPYPADAVPIVFTGAMDYWPNVDAVCWFANEILPSVCESIPEASFYIVGSNPPDSVNALGKQPGICVTGRVEDVRPYVKHAACVVAPLKLARGVQNKVLEGMAMARPVVVTPQAAEGISAQAGIELLVADNASKFADHVIASCRKHFPEMGSKARNKIEQSYNWQKNLSRLLPYLSGKYAIGAHEY